ncbi:hypothetical protein HN51_015417 [Arachis hypogaea]|uniref:BTB domain-containing protein n=1 Tax=Arachis hypogaea TaxID=3818 RepID=A0A445CKN6_ARAHY|nr:ARM REPEAT PROTEIN INTERACTING WITH ABF2 [Arachis hypogaea]QHO45860.1 ARM REPEAT PROTEIN INTERACTING WITH [Arachis hypogaea]RYR51484.1 hypothetical protein Ahy_A06g026502 [Arachis hypogaea]
MAPKRKSLKRKLEHDLVALGSDRAKSPQPLQNSPPPSSRDFSAVILSHVDLLNSPSSTYVTDRAALFRSLHALSDLAQNEEMVDDMVKCGVVPAVVKHLEVPIDDDCVCGPYGYEVEKKCAIILGLLANKPEHQHLIVDAGALPYIVDLLKRHKTSSIISPGLVGLLRRLADAITNLAHENTTIKNLVRMEGGIPPLVELLEFNDRNVQKAAAGALRTLAFKNDENKNQIVECKALPTLVLMLRSEDPTVHYEAVGVIGNLVHSSPNIKKEVIQAGALQPVIGLLSSSCLESQREAALLLGQFASTDTDCKVHIAQRGAIQPLVGMLKSSDSQLKEMSAFALGRLAQDSHNQAGIAYHGGIEPLIDLLSSKNAFIQHNAAFALYGLVDNEDIIADVIKAGGFHNLQDGSFKAQPTRECVAKTLTRFEEKIQGQVLKHLSYLMRFAEKGVQRRVALALAHLCPIDDCRTIFIDNNGLELLLELLGSTNLKQTGVASLALHKLATRAISVPLGDVAPSSPTPQEFLGKHCVNNPKLSDVTFLVEGKRFYAHRVCLVKSDIFRAMFDGGYREREAKDIEIPNIKWDVFELMMRYIYTGTADVSLDIAQDLLKAADQYLLEGLKRLCENTISQDITAENVALMYQMSDTFNATSLKHACIMFVLDQFDKLSSKPWYGYLVCSIVPDIRKFFSTLLGKSSSADS